MNTETITKEQVAGSVFFRRIVRNQEGVLISDDRMKRDPTLTFTQPEPITLDSETSVAAFTVVLPLHDFNGEARSDDGPVQLRLHDASDSYDDAFLFTRQMSGGVLTFTIEIATPGEYVVTVVPPVLADLQLSEPNRLRVL